MHITILDVGVGLDGVSILPSLHTQVANGVQLLSLSDESGLLLFKQLEFNHELLLVKKHSVRFQVVHNILSRP